MAHMTRTPRTPRTPHMTRLTRREVLLRGAALASGSAWLAGCANVGTGAARYVDEGPTDLPIHIDRSVSIPLRDGGSISADIFRPRAPGRWPVIMSMGPYPKGIPLRTWAPDAFERQPMKSGAGADDLMHWETALPDYWVPRGYVQIRCDQRGSGASAGKLDVLGPQVQRDFVEAIDWAGTQPWSNGNVGLLGDSYFAALQWLVAQHRPRHLKAIAPVQGFTDFYRDALRHGGILSSRFLDLWFESRVRQWQFGGARLAGANALPATLPASELAANTVWDRDFRRLLREETLATSTFAAERTPDLARIDVPV